MFCEGSLERLMIKIQSFSRTSWSTNSIGLKAGLLTLEQVSIPQWLRKRRRLMGKTSINSADSEANWSGVVNFHCMQMTLVLSVSVVYSR